VFRTVFAADPSKVHSWAPLPYVAVAAALYLYSVRLRRRDELITTGRGQLWSVRAGVVLSALGALLAVVMTIGEYRLCSTPIDSSDVSVAVGPVRDFVPVPATGHGVGSFSVDNQQFEFSGMESGCSFHWAAVSGGPLREGMVVRIHSKYGRILRLDVEQ
jgi:hypothetical protein